MQPLKKPRITADEQKYLKIVFENREDLIVLIRDLFFGYRMTETEKETLQKLFSSVELRRIMRKIVLPELERGLPIGESVDLWMTLNLSENEKANKLNIAVREELISMFETALALMDNINGEAVDLTPKKNVIALLARVSFTSNIEARLNEIWLMAHKVEETAEEMTARLLKDSTK